MKLTPGLLTRACTIRPWISTGWANPARAQPTLQVGPRGGRAVTRTLHSGAGLVPVSVGHQASVTAISYYVLAP